MGHWPPLTDGYWLLKEGPTSPWLTVELRGQGKPVLQLPAKTLINTRRLHPLFQVGSIAAWRRESRGETGIFRIQLHDEDPGQDGLRFDANLSDNSPLIPDPYALGTQGYRFFREELARKPLPEWRNRRQKFFWRGSSTGFEGLAMDNLGNNSRYALCRKSHSQKDNIDARISAVVQCRDEQERAAIQDHLIKHGLMGERLDPWTYSLHQYLLEIDGNVNSWGLLWKLLSGGCILKVKSKRRQWYHHKLIDYVHVVPISEDLADLEDRIEWCLSNPKTCEEIGRNGQILGYQIATNLGRSVIKAVDSLTV